jgi:hypothetical protein
MNRRNFIKTSGIALSSLAFSSKLFSGNLNLESSFSFDVITDKPEIAIIEISSFFKKSNFKKISFSQNEMLGSFMSDIVFINNNNLQDFKSGKSLYNNEITEIYKKLNLGKTLNNPQLISFKTLNNDISPQSFTIKNTNKIIDIIPINQKVDNYHFISDKGELYLEISNGKAKINHSSCKHKTCIKKGEISGASDNIICIPNQFHLSINSSSKKIFDTISY